jgi:hypothetical protein
MVSEPMRKIFLVLAIFLLLCNSACTGGSSSDSTTNTTVTPTTVSVSGTLSLPADNTIDHTNLFPAKNNIPVKLTDLTTFSLLVDGVTQEISATGAYSFTITPKADVLLKAQNNLKSGSGKIVLYRRIPGEITAGQTLTNINLNTDSTAIELCNQKLKESFDFQFSWLTSKALVAKYAAVKTQLDALLAADTSTAGVATLVEHTNVTNQVVVSINSMIPVLKPSIAETTNFIFEGIPDPQNRSATLLWTAVERAGTYEIYLNEQTTPVTTVTTTQKTIEGLPLGKNTFWIRAVNTFGNSAFSDPTYITF